MFYDNIHMEMNDIKRNEGKKNIIKEHEGSDDEYNKGKLNKSPRSPLSSKSLLSSRSPRYDTSKLLTTLKKPIILDTRERKGSQFSSESEDEDKMGRSRFGIDQFNTKQNLIKNDHETRSKTDKRMDRIVKTRKNDETKVDESSEYAINNKDDSENERTLNDENSSQLEKKLFILDNLLSTDDDMKTDRSLHLRKEDFSKNPDLGITNISNSIKNENTTKIEVEDVIKDKIISEKLKKEREEKNKQRLDRIPKTTTTNNIIQSAIDVVENSNEDQLRFNNLKSKVESFEYDTKPSLNGSKNLRTRSASLTRTKNPYSGIKPKVNTRMTQDGSFSALNTDNSAVNELLNDSINIRNSAYEEWYMKKHRLTKEEIEMKHNQIKDEEEKKAKEMIEKLKKASYVLNIWNAKKLEEIKNKNKEKMNHIIKCYENEKVKTDEKKKSAEKAFEIWKKNKDYDLKVKIKKLKHVVKNDDTKSEDKEKTIESEKAFKLWKEEKDRELKEKIEKAKIDKNKEKSVNSEKKNNQSYMSAKAYQEWLEKKESAKDSLNKASNESMDLPPFYPSSKTASFSSKSFLLS